MEFKAIELAHRASVDEIRQRHGHTLSSHSFVSLFLWRTEMGLSLFLDGRFFVVKCLWKGRNSYLFPCGDPGMSAGFIGAHVSEPDFKLCYMRDEDVDFLAREFPGKFLTMPDRDSAEYLYDRAEQTGMRGSRYSSLRRQVRRLEREHELDMEPLTRENIARARGLVADWRAVHPGIFGIGLDDAEVSLEALELREELGLSGVLVRVDGVDGAVLAGGFISCDTFDLCLAKTAFRLPGFDFYTKLVLYGQLPEECRFINREEDLGIEGLRANKLGMHPCALTRIWEGTAVNG